MGRFYDILDFTLFEGVNKDGIAEFLKNASKKISSYKKGDIAIFQDSLCKSLSLLCQGTLLAKMTNAEGKEIVIEHLAAPEILAPAFIYGTENRFPVTLRIVSYLQRNGVITNIQDVAFIMGVARPSLSRTLSAMVDEGVLIKTEEGYRLSK